jgi:type 1 glutamine amidotransferase
MSRASPLLRFAPAWFLVVGCSTGSPAEQTCTNGEVDVGETYGPAVDAGPVASPRILLYAYSNGYRHASIPDGINAIRALGVANGFGVDVKGTAPDAQGSYCANQPAEADATSFAAELLSQYAATVFLNTTTTVDRGLLDDGGKAALEAYVRAGGGFVGIHAAADAESGWPFYRELVGASFLAHGPPVTASLRIEDQVHPATMGLPDPWSRFDEWFDFTSNPRQTAHVLVDLDESTYPGRPEPFADHPIAWCKTVGAGRSFYTGIGHTSEAFADALVRRHITGGILYAAGAIPADCSVARASP